ncbi:unnamed protein product [Echinostoma caproni]|uniref:Uncharacterized protein n=1 Tax=Echinostoma caproni TaxID=27848 RepID=A0A183AL48_9TREM|nr:unnamed protein product [Echinostoma caproni]
MVNNPSDVRLWDFVRSPTVDPNAVLHMNPTCPVPWTAVEDKHQYADQALSSVILLPDRNRTFAAHFVRSHNPSPSAEYRLLSIIYSASKADRVYRHFTRAHSTTPQNDAFQPTSVSDIARERLPSEIAENLNHKSPSNAFQPRLSPVKDVVDPLYLVPPRCDASSKGTTEGSALSPQAVCNSPSVPPTLSSCRTGLEQNTNGATSSGPSVLAKCLENCSRIPLSTVRRRKQVFSSIHRYTEELFDEQSTDHLLLTVSPDSSSPSDESQTGELSPSSSTLRPLFVDLSSKPNKLPNTDQRSSLCSITAVTPVSDGVPSASTTPHDRVTQEMSTTEPEATEHIPAAPEAVVSSFADGDEDDLVFLGFNLDGKMACRSLNRSATYKLGEPHADRSKSGTALGSSRLRPRRRSTPIPVNPQKSPRLSEPVKPVKLVSTTPGTIQPADRITVDIFTGEVYVDNRPLRALIGGMRLTRNIPWREEPALGTRGGTRRGRAAAHSAPTRFQRGGSHGRNSCIGDVFSRDMQNASVSIKRTGRGNSISRGRRGSALLARKTRDSVTRTRDPLPASKEVVVVRGPGRPRARFGRMRGSSPANSSRPNQSLLCVVPPNSNSSPASSDLLTNTTPNGN